MIKTRIHTRTFICFIIFVFPFLFLASAPAPGQSRHHIKTVALNKKHFAPLNWYASKGYTAQANYKKVVNVHFLDISLEKALKKIARKGYLRLSYSKKELAGHNVTLIRHNVTIIEAVKDALQGTGLEAVASPDGQVVIKKEKREFLSTVKRPDPTVSGTVTDAQTGDPLPGVNILVVGTSSGAATDADGHYSVSVPSLQDTLRFSFIGYQTQTMPIDGQTRIDVSMNSKVFTGNQLVVIGMGTEKRQNITGSVGTVSGEEIEKSNPVDAMSSLRGRVSGLKINNTSGAPGSPAKVRIRGTSTLNGGTSPLYIVDGQPVENLSLINPNSIASISVLKSGAAAAIYGSRGANGVVIVTTKEGGTNGGGNSIDISYKRGYSVAREMPYMNTLQRIQYEGFRGKGPKGIRKDKRNQLYNININFQDLMERVAKENNANISFSGGNNDNNYFWNVGFLNDQGVKITTYSRRINTRLNLNHKFNDIFNLKLRTSFAYKLRNNIEGRVIGQGYNNQQMLWSAPWAIVYGRNGKLLPGTKRYQLKANPVKYYKKSTNKNKHYRGNLYFSLNINLTNNLSYEADFGGVFDFQRFVQFYPPATLGVGDVTANSNFNSGLRERLLQRDRLKYNKNIGKNQIKVLAGLSFQESRHPIEQINSILSNTIVKTINNAKLINLSNTFTQKLNEHSLASFFGRARYIYNNKYILSASIRRDGSSRFSKGNRWGIFPAIGAAWRFANESFMDNVGFISSGKLKASYAKNGNERIGNRDFVTLLNTGKFYQGVNGVGISNRLGNPAIRWETTKQIDVGLNLGFINDRIGFKFDYYVKKTNHLLANELIPAQTGSEDVRVNIGKVSNKGINLSLQAKIIKLNNFSWNSTFNFSANRNTVLKLAGGRPIVTTANITKVGSPIGSFYGYKILGVFPYDESNAFTDDGQQLMPHFNKNGKFTHYTLNGKVYKGHVNRKTVSGIVSGGGDYNYKDLNDDFKITDADREILGNSAEPKYFGGWRNDINYKNIHLSFLFGYQFGVSLYDRMWANTSTFHSDAASPAPWTFENRWMHPGDKTAKFPGGPNRVQDLLGAFSGVPTSLFIENSSFIRLRNVTVNYDLPRSLINKFNMSDLSVFVSVSHALTWTQYRGFDPESTSFGNPLAPGIDDGRYPPARKFMFGINIKF